MHAARILVAIIAVVALAGCGDDADDATPAATSTTSTTVPSSTTSAATTTAPTTSTTTTLPVDTVPVDTAPVDTVPVDTVPVDTVPPPAPTNVTCAPGGGSQEVLLEWDAPEDPDDVVDVRFYVNDGSGFARVNTFAVESGQVLIGAFRWSAVAYPVPVDTQVRMAVTVADAAGNESGWNPIDVFYEYSGADCLN